MTNITSTLPSTFKIRPTIPFLFIDAKSGASKYMNMVGEYHYDIERYEDILIVKFTATKPIHTTIKGFISEQDLVSGIIKGKLLIVKEEDE